ncbi:MAG TPA: hypothetical protein VIJ12_03690 [Candidatus Baltobacteraceae bacterium]
MKALAIVLTIVFIVAAVLTATGAAHFAPVLGFNGTHHLKHTILYVVLAVLCAIWARMDVSRATH